MECQRIGIVVYLHISIVPGDNFADAFKSETMLMAAGYTYSRTTVFRDERICPAGIYDRQNGNEVRSLSAINSVVPLRISA